MQAQVWFEMIWQGTPAKVHLEHTWTPPGISHRIQGLHLACQGLQIPGPWLVIAGTGWSPGTVWHFCVILIVTLLWLLSVTLLCDSSVTLLCDSFLRLGCDSSLWHCMTLICDTAVTVWLWFDPDLSLWFDYWLWWVTVIWSFMSDCDMIFGLDEWLWFDLGLWWVTVIRSLAWWVTEIKIIVFDEWLIRSLASGLDMIFGLDEWLW